MSPLCYSGRRTTASLSLGCLLYTPSAICYHFTKPQPHTPEQWDQLEFGSQAGKPGRGGRILEMFKELTPHLSFKNIV